MPSPLCFQNICILSLITFSIWWSAIWETYIRRPPPRPFSQTSAIRSPLQRLVLLCPSTTPCERKCSRCTVYEYHLFLTNGDFWVNVLRWNEWAVVRARRQQLSGERIKQRACLLHTPMVGPCWGDSANEFNSTIMEIYYLNFHATLSLSRWVYCAMRSNNAYNVSFVLSFLITKICIWYTFIDNPQVI